LCTHAVGGKARGTIAVPDRADRGQRQDGDDGRGHHDEWQHEAGASSAFSGGAAHFRL